MSIERTSSRTHRRVVIAVLVCLVVLPSALAWAAPHVLDRGGERRPIDAPARGSDVHATQTGSRTASRAAHVRWARRETLDSANEACEARTVRAWARILEVRSDRRSVARAFARRNYPRALWPAVEKGCLEGLPR